MSQGVESATFWSRSAIGLGLALLAGCSLINPGIAPPRTRLNFPTAVAIQGRYLLVVNSNFNLRYNAGSLQSYGLDRLNAELAARCPTRDQECLLYQGDEPVDAVVDEVAIGTQADGIALNPAGDRIYLPVRGERDVTFINFDGAAGGLDCGQQDNVEGVPKCAERFRAVDPGARDLGLDGDPVDLVSGPLSDLGATTPGDYVLVALRAGAVALLIDEPDGVPTLAHVSPGFADDLVTLSREPGAGLAWLASARTRDLNRAAIFFDETNPERPFVQPATPVRLQGLDDGADVRQILFHPSRDSLVVLNRRPEMVLEVERSGPRAGEVRRQVAVGRGPSRMRTARLGNRDYLLVTCYNAQSVFVIDLETLVLVGNIGGFSGPFDFAVDEVDGRAYVADFATSVIHIIDLRPLETGGVPELIARVGSLRPFRSLTGSN